jgi:hypothetical protein
VLDTHPGKLAARLGAPLLEASDQQDGTMQDGEARPPFASLHEAGGIEIRLQTKINL